MGNEDYEGFKVLRAKRRATGERNRQQARRDFQQATDMADQYGFELVKHTNAHYQIRKGGKLLSIYPGNQRLYGPDFGYVIKTWGAAWTLMDIVKAVSNND